MTVDFDSVFAYSPCKDGMKRAHLLGKRKGCGMTISMAELESPIDRIWFVQCLPDSPFKAMFFANLILHLCRFGLIDQKWANLPLEILGALIGNNPAPAEVPDFEFGVLHKLPKESIDTLSELIDQELENEQHT